MIDGQQWTTTEHYFQAQKFTHKTELAHLVEHVKSLAEPRECFDFVRRPEIQHLIRPRDQWHGPPGNPIKNQVMRKVVFAKFSQDLL